MRPFYIHFSSLYSYAVLMDFLTALLILCVCAGSSFSGYDDTSSDNSTADAADPSAASPEPSAAPGSSPAAAGPHVTAGNVQVTVMNHERFCPTRRCVFQTMNVTVWDKENPLMYRQRFTKIHSL